MPSGVPAQPAGERSGYAVEARSDSTTTLVVAPCDPNVSRHLRPVVLFASTSVPGGQPDRRAWLRCYACGRRWIEWEWE